MKPCVRVLEAPYQSSLYAVQCRHKSRLLQVRRLVQCHQLHPYRNPAERHQGLARPSTYQLQPNPGQPNRLRALPNLDGAVTNSFVEPVAMIDMLHQAAAGTCRARPVPIILVRQENSREERVGYWPAYNRAAGQLLTITDAPPSTRLVARIVATAIAPTSKDLRPVLHSAADSARLMRDCHTGSSRRAV